jgi:hypothetical protein
MVPLFGSDRGLLVAPGLFRAPLTLARAQADGARSTALSSDDVTWREFGPDVPRFNGAAQRLMIGGQRTNAVRNPRAEGAIPGTPGTAPTNWGANTADRTIHGVVVLSGLTLLDLTYALAAAGNRQLSFDTAFAVGAPGEIWTSSAFVRLESGTGVSAKVEIEFRDSGGVLLDVGSSATLTTMGVLTRLSVSRVAPAGTARVTAQIRFDYASATTARAQYGAAQTELGAFASTPILPAVGTPAASTRGADLVSATLASLGIGANGACTVLGTAMLPQASPAAGSFTLFSISDGTANNRIFVRDNNSTNLLLWRVAGGAASNASAGSYTAGTVFRFGASIDGAGRVAFSNNGGTAATVTGAPTSGLGTLNVGNGVAGTEAFYGEIGRLRVLPFPVSDAELQRLVAEQPT